MSRLTLENGIWNVSDDISYASVTYEEIDLTDGSWTLVDPASLVKSITISNGVHTITINEHTASQDISVFGSNHNWPRWYKNLEADGVRINGADLHITNTYLGNVSHTDTGSATSPGIMFGPAVDPTNNLAYGMYGWGSHVRVSNPYGASWTINLEAAGVGANQENFYGSHLGGAGDAMLAQGVNLSSSYDYISKHARQTNNTGVGSNDLFIQVGVGAANGSSALYTDTTISFKAKYNVMKIVYS